MKDGQRKRYQVPANFFSTGRVLGGLFGARGFAEGLIAALPFGVAILLSGLEYTLKVPLLIFVGGGVFLCVNAYRETGSAFGRLTEAVRWKRMVKKALRNPKVKEFIPEYLIGTRKEETEEGLREKFDTERYIFTEDIVERPFKRRRSFEKNAGKNRKTGIQTDEKAPEGHRGEKTKKGKKGPEDPGKAEEKGEKTDEGLFDAEPHRHNGHP